MISCVILAKNEEKYIQKCINSVLWCNEVVLIDDYSSDKTVNLAKKLGVKIYKHKLNNDFSAQRNFGLSKATSEWVLFLDADEIVSKELSDEIRNNISHNFDGYLIKRSDVFLGRNIRGGESGNIYLLRLAKKNSGRWKRKVHEYWRIKGNIEKFNSPMYHYSHESLTQFVNQINFHSNLHALENKNERKNSNLIKIIFYPSAKFFNNFVLKLGFTDGMHGFVLAVFMSFHSFLSWSELWISQNYQKKSQD